MTFSQMQTDVLDALSLVSSDVSITTTQIKKYLNRGKDWALAYKKWPFLEYKGSDLIDATGAYAYPSLIKTKSVFLLIVNGKEFDKIRYRDYLKYLEDQPAGTDRVYSEFGRTLYINGNACAVGNAIDIYGIKGVADLSGDSDTSPFNDAEPSGDEAIVNYAISKGIKKLDGTLTEAKDALLEAKEILNAIWDRMVEAMPREQTKTTPLLKRINMIGGYTTNSNPNNIGKF